MEILLRVISQMGVCVIILSLFLDSRVILSTDRIGSSQVIKWKKVEGYDRANGRGMKWQSNIV